MANVLQIREIERFHRHLERCGRARTLDDTARVWIFRYARLWRNRYESTTRDV